MPDPVDYQDLSREMTPETNPDPCDHARRAAVQDAATVVAEATEMLSRMAPGERVLLMDGSQYSPAWRAMAGGAHAWGLSEAFDDLGESGLIVEAYSEELDAAIGETDLDGASISWDEGCLFLDAPDPDDDETEVAA
jgi:hypothetical protein